MVTPFTRAFIIPAATVVVMGGSVNSVQAGFPPVSWGDPPPISTIPAPSPLVPAVPNIPVPPVPPTPFSPPSPPTIIVVEVPVEVPTDCRPCVVPPVTPERPTDVPEPATVVGVLIGGAAVALRRRKS